MREYKARWNGDNTSSYEYRGSLVSMTIPDQSLSVKELFERYVTGTLEKEAVYAANKAAEYDGENVRFEDYVPNLDANEAYEIAQNLKAKRAAERTHAKNRKEVSTPAITPDTSFDNTTTSPAPPATANSETSEAE